MAGGSDPRGEALEPLREEGGATPEVQAKEVPVPKGLPGGEAQTVPLKVCRRIGEMADLRVQ